MSWKPEVQTVGDGDNWTGNALRFASKEEAERYVFDLSMRWTSVTETRAIEVNEPVNYRIRDGKLEAIAVTSSAAMSVEPSARIADRIDGYDRDDLGESPDY